MNDEIKSLEKPSRSRKIEITIECEDRFDFIFRLDKLLRKKYKLRKGFYIIHIEKVEMPI